jgi:hypothetical protein
MGLLYQSLDEALSNNNYQEKTEVLEEKPASSSLSSPPTSTTLGLNPGLRRQKWTTNRLSSVSDLFPA